MRMRRAAEHFDIVRAAQHADHPPRAGVGAGLQIECGVANHRYPRYGCTNTFCIAWKIR